MPEAFNPCFSFEFMLRLCRAAHRVEWLILQIEILEILYLHICHLRVVVSGSKTESKRRGLNELQMA